MEANGHSWSDLTQMARDRDGWRMFIRGLYPGDVETQQKHFFFRRAFKKITLIILFY